MHIVQSLRIPMELKIAITRLPDSGEKIAELIIKKCKEVNDGAEFNYVVPKITSAQVLHTVTLPFDKNTYIAGKVLENLAIKHKTNNSNIIKSILLQHFTPTLAK